MAFRTSSHRFPTSRIDELIIKIWVILASNNSRIDLVEIAIESVVFRCRTALHVVPPIARKHFLAEYCAIGTEERVLSPAFFTDVKHLV